jgi:hypothetical protein
MRSEERRQKTFTPNREVSPVGIFGATAGRVTLAASGALFLVGAAALMALLTLQCALASHQSRRIGRKGPVLRSRWVDAVWDGPAPAARAAPNGTDARSRCTTADADVDHQAYVTDFQRETAMQASTLLIS